MSSRAHLHPVPDPEDDAPSGPAAYGARAAGAAQEGPAGDGPGDHPPQEPGTAAGDTPGDPVVQAAPRRALAMPDLRPYATLDRRTAAELVALTTDLSRAAGRRAAPRLAGVPRFLWTPLRTGTQVLLAVTRGWFAGDLAPKTSPVTRLLVAPGLAVYATVHTVAVYPLAPFAMLPAWSLAAVIAERWATTRVSRARTTKNARTPAKTERPALGPLTARLADIVTPPVNTAAPTDQNETAPAQGPYSTDEESTQTPADGPAEDLLTALLRELIGTDNGIHLQDLRPAMRDRLPGLQNATDEQLRQSLLRAGYNPARKFRARGKAGRAGVHRDELPPPRSPAGAPRSLSGPLSAAGERRRPADSPSWSPLLSGSGERTDSKVRIVPDPERGPSAWRVERIPE